MLSKLRTALVVLLRYIADRLEPVPAVVGQAPVAAATPADVLEPIGERALTKQEFNAALAAMHLHRALRRYSPPDEVFRA